MNDPVARLEAFIITIPRDTPYLGALSAQEQPNARGYFVRAGNRTVYPTVDRSVIVRLETRDGVVGWGETYGIVAPGAVLAIVNDLLADFVTGRQPGDASVIFEDLYDLMRVRGYTGGFYLDALAAVDIALWDAYGRQVNLPLARLLGGRRHQRIPAYISGLPCDTLAGRVDFAAGWQEKGFEQFKFAIAGAGQTPVAELAALRERLGPGALIAADLHWKYSVAEAITLIQEMQKHGLWFAEAPCASEDLAGQARIAASVAAPLALGEEWRTVFDILPRLQRQAMSIFQPEMGHTGVTQFVRMGQLTQAYHGRIIPHATIGIGLFLGASLQASASLQAVCAHEYQHSVFDRNLRFITGGLRCENGFYTVPDGPGLGVEPSPEALQLLQKE